MEQKYTLHPSFVHLALHLQHHLQIRQHQKQHPIENEILLLKMNNHTIMIYLKIQTFVIEMMTLVIENQIQQLILMNQSKKQIQFQVRVQIKVVGMH